MQLSPRQLELFRARPAATRVPTLVDAPAAPQPVPTPTFDPERATAPARSAEPDDDDADFDEHERLPEAHEVPGLARELAHRLAVRVGGELKVLLTVHDNKSTMISFRRQPPVLKVRLHHLFLEAPDAVVDAIADYAARGRRSAGQVLDEFIAQRQERIRATPTTPSALVSRGECFDLQAIFDELNALHFQSGIRARIGWGRHTAKRRRKSIRLGVYDHKAREIRIHPALDKPDVPRFFVAFIVFHEMLHQLFPSERDTGRHVHHPRAFRDREKAFPLYEAAMTWEREHLNQLLRR